MRDVFNALSEEMDAYDPMKQAQKSMKKEYPKRFWNDACLQEKDGCYFLALDGRLAKTPARNFLHTNHRDIAECIKNEWHFLEGEIIPDKMPMTRLINSALDSLPEYREAMQKEALRFIDTDMLLYQAAQPEGLMKMQQDLWQPLLEKIEAHYEFCLKTTFEIMAIEQESFVHEGFREALEQISQENASLLAFNLGVALTGSFLLMLGYCHGFIDEEDLWNAAHIDEDWNMLQWGDDEAALKLRASKRKDFDAACFVLKTYSLLKV